MGISWSPLCALKGVKPPLPLRQTQRSPEGPRHLHRIPRLSEAQAGFRKGRGTRDQIANIPWIMEKAREFQKNINFCFIAGGFGIVNKAEIDVSLELSCFFHDPADVGNLISGSYAFSKTSLNIWKFMVHVLLKPGLENFEHYFTSV